MVAPKDGVCSAPGTGFESGEKNTALQGHVAFFDRDSDGIIWPTDTYNGFREIRFGVFLALLSTIIVHGGFSYITCPGLFPDPFFRLYIRNMHRGIHGSDSGSYTKLGEFDVNRFDYNFDMYSSDPHTHLTFAQGVRMLHGNLNPFDPFGWFAATFEWLATYIMLWPSDSRGMNKEDVKAVYNGSIFYQISGKKVKA
ncbi:hypothetical protein D9619_003652 [Psilocybe cf. subviscida]|uniref:Caleosin n=1 Tax=Psilocybe cf. subviscida TaxID=2480587 RepID=A0A8H5AWJ7_9AGAR|nr:hypothetical protein D9619_003652 [Psilocybe cf. subviscida]